MDIYAHKKNTSYETLERHITNSLCAFDLFDEKYKILDKVNSLFKSLEITKIQKKQSVHLSDNEIDYLLKCFIDIIKYHDAGKINPVFQKEKMDQNIKLNKNQTTSAHSLLSTMIYLNEHILSIPSDCKEKLFIKYIIIIFSNVILSHHGELKDFSIDNIKQGFNLINEGDYLCFYDKDFSLEFKDIDIIDKFKRLIDVDYMDIYILAKISFSVLISCDFIATSKFYNEEIEISTLPENLHILFDNNMKSFKEKTNQDTINVLREEIFNECVNTILENKDAQIFNLESPTGSGKTISSLGVITTLLKENKDVYKNLIYVAPYNTITDQTYKVITNIFGEENTCQINSVSEIKKQGSYNISLLNRQLLNYPIVFTSNIKLFNMFFGCSRDNSLGTLKLFDSIIVLDEIQGYNNKIWTEFIEFMDKYSNIFNIKVIIMSATMPNLETLLKTTNRRFCNLIKEPSKYFSNPHFKERVKIDFSLVNREIGFEEILDKIIENINNRNNKYNSCSKFIIEFINKKTAKAFYDFVKTKNLINYDVHEIDGDDNILHRNHIIGLCNSNVTRNLLIITTQTFECGVDIDMDLGAKDSSFPDLDEQFIGRVNRSNKKQDCTVFLFNYDNEKNIYKNDYRIGSNIRNDKFKQCLQEKEFRVEYDYVLNKIEYDKKQCTKINIDYFYALLKNSSYKEIENYMKLIDQTTKQIFIQHKYIFNGKTYDGFSVWNRYLDLLNDKTMGFSERKIKLHNLRKEMDIFMYNVYVDDLPEDLLYGGIYLIQDGEKYIDNGKFNSDLFYNIKR